ncbi:MAG TPA: hypothetical protein VHJ20_14900 [Polyangia bacterium]|nr:hypothetical protein [Polyangia bacterium]
MTRFSASGIAIFATAFALGCGGSVTALSHDGGAGATGSGGKIGGGAGATGTGGVTGTGGSVAGGTTGAGGGSVNKIPIGSTQCSDGIDNDGDGLIDLADPECTGPADNDESSFATGIPGDNKDACKQDCFFDGNSGMGDDGCLWELKCDPLSTESSCPYDMSYADKHAMECSVSASQSQRCIDFCQRLVPNGCDCFGCCAIPGAPHPIRLAATCTAKDFGDPTKCPVCTQVAQCSNPCDRCELCVGKTTVPDDCAYTPPTPTDGGTPYDGGAPPPKPDAGGYAHCSNGTSCTTSADCPMNYACLTGCCIAYIP